MKFYRGSAAAARSYVEADHSRADDYYLAEGTGLAEHYLAGHSGMQRVGDLDGPTYERWVAGHDVLTGAAALTIFWLILWWMYQRRLFLRI